MFFCKLKFITSILKFVVKWNYIQFECSDWPFEYEAQLKFEYSMVTVLVYNLFITSAQLRSA